MITKVRCKSVELNDAHDPNGQRMLRGYPLSRLETPGSVRLDMQKMLSKKLFVDIGNAFGNQ